MSLQESSTPSSPPLIPPPNCETGYELEGESKKTMWGKPNKQGLENTLKEPHLILTMITEWPHGPGTKMGTAWTSQSQ